MDTLIICFVGAALLKGIESQPIPNPTTLYMGCYTNIAMDDGMSRYQNNTPALIQPKDCITFCIYSPAGIGTFSYAGIRFIGNSQYCYCFNDVKDNHILSKGAECDTLCFFNDNPVEICKYKNTAKVWSLCPSGFYYPPLCEAQCPDNCLPNGLGLRACGHGGKCAFACRRGICRDSYHCFNVSGLDGISPTPKPSQEFYMPTGTYLFTGMKFTKPGNVTVISFYAKSKGTASVGVWRRSTQTGVAQWILVGKIQVVYNDAPGYFIRELSALEIFYAQVGDIVGIHQDSSAMANKDVFTQKYFTIFSLLQISDPRNTIFTTLYGSGTYLFNPSLYDSNWVVGKSLMESILTPSAMADARFFPDLQLGLDCPCSTGCQKGSCGLRTGSCTQGCIPGLKGPLCDIECSPGWHGSDCQQPCSTNCKSNTCHNILGICTNGCELGYVGTNCENQCLKHKFGPNCMLDCSPNCIKNECDPHSGTCLFGCMLGYDEPMCLNKCPAGLFGRDCKPCGFCAFGRTCDPITGDCGKLGCVIGYQPPDCTKPCANGYYGVQCYDSCGHCKLGTTCHSITGECTAGCADGYFGIMCDDICSTGTYGASCSKTCGFCRGYTNCDITDGSCVAGCIEGYAPPDCHIECLDGRYGDACLHQCGKCGNGIACSKADGKCPNGCEDGYKPPACRCKVGYYGADCDKKCGKCADGADCDALSGSCPDGCGSQNMLPPNCIDVIPSCPRNKYGLDCSQTCGNCKKFPGESSDCFSYDGSCLTGCEAGFQPPMCVDLCPTGTYGWNCEEVCGSCRDILSCNPINGYCSDCNSGYEMPLCKNTCTLGFYGLNCMFKCGACVLGTMCDAITGLCPYNCQPGYYGKMCLIDLLDEKGVPLQLLAVPAKGIPKSKVTKVTVAYIYLLFCLCVAVLEC